MISFWSTGLLVDYLVTTHDLCKYPIQQILERRLLKLKRYETAQTEVRPERTSVTNGSGAYRKLKLAVALCPTFIRAFAGFNVNYPCQYKIKD